MGLFKDVPTGYSWFDEDEKDVNYMSGPSQSTDLSPTEQLWEEEE